MCHRRAAKTRHCITPQNLLVYELLSAVLKRSVPYELLAPILTFDKSAADFNRIRYRAPGWLLARAPRCGTEPEMEDGTPP
jgi:hypothetical protein